MQVDIKLIVSLLKYITSSSEADAAILVFLPGYDDIVNLRDQLLSDSSTNFIKNRYRVYINAKISPEYGVDTIIKNFFTPCI